MQAVRDLADRSITTIPWSAYTLVCNGWLRLGGTCKRVVSEVKTQEVRDDYGYL